MANKKVVKVNVYDEQTRKIVFIIDFYSIGIVIIF